MNETIVTWYFTLYVGGPHHGEMTDDFPLHVGYPTPIKGMTGNKPLDVAAEKPVMVSYHHTLETDEARQLALLSIEGVKP